MARLAPVMFRCALTFEHSIGGSLHLRLMHSFLFLFLVWWERQSDAVDILPSRHSFGTQKKYDRIGVLHLVVINARQ